MTENEKMYLASISMAKTLMKQGLLTEKEYRQIETIFREKYRPTFGSILSEYDLIILENRGIYDGDGGAYYAND